MTIIDCTIFEDEVMHIIEKDPELMRELFLRAKIMHGCFL
jgi:hypothetical protein